MMNGILITYMDVFVNPRGPLVSMRTKDRRRNGSAQTVHVVSIFFLFLILLIRFQSHISSHSLSGHCPSGDNPRTLIDETDCFNVTAKGSRRNGSIGNICHVDCSNQGICNYKTGVCSCFNGFYGPNCGISDALATRFWYLPSGEAAAVEGGSGGEFDEVANLLDGITDLSFFEND
jgi:hypothetical protein